MKLRHESPMDGIKSSPPAWGAWIETRFNPTRVAHFVSPPAWGAWIETCR